MGQSQWNSGLKKWELESEKFYWLQSDSQLVKNTNSNSFFKKYKEITLKQFIKGHEKRLEQSFIAIKLAGNE